MSDWDAQTYHRLSDPQFAWGLRVLDRLRPVAGERILDLGCGSGRLTDRLADAMGRGVVVGLDLSQAMLAEAAVRLAERHRPVGPHRMTDAGIEVHLVRGDAARLPFVGAFDAVFSAATFHWVQNHDKLFSSIHRALAPGGRLVAQCGGVGNIASIQRALARVGDGWLGPVHFATPLDTVRRLDAAGFVDIECWLTDEPTRFEPGEPFETYLRTVVLGAHLERLPPSEHDEFVASVVAGIGEPLIDYVRLNIVARRSSLRPDRPPAAGGSGA